MAIRVLHCPAAASISIPSRTARWRDPTAPWHAAYDHIVVAGGLDLLGPWRSTRWSNAEKTSLGIYEIDWRRLSTPAVKPAMSANRIDLVVAIGVAWPVRDLADRQRQREHVRQQRLRPFVLELSDRFRAISFANGETTANTMRDLPIHL